MCCQYRDHTVSTIHIKGRDVLWHDLDTVSSTMDYAHNLVIENGVGWIAVTARSQSSGRGTRGRYWVSSYNDGLWLSLIIPPEGRDKFDGLTIAAAQVLVTVLDKLFGMTCSIKQPNDVLAAGKKIAGILIESGSTGATFEYLILGMGLNLSQDKSFFEKSEIPDATSIYCETGTIPDRDEVLKAYITAFIDRYETEILL